MGDYTSAFGTQINTRTPTRTPIFIIRIIIRCHLGLQPILFRSTICCYRRITFKRPVRRYMFNFPVWQINNLRKRHKIWRRSISTRPDPALPKRSTISRRSITLTKLWTRTSKSIYGTCNNISILQRTRNSHFNYSIFIIHRRNVTCIICTTNKIN
jgi:hypothetical protein